MKKINETATNDKVVSTDIYQKFLGDYNLEFIGIPTGDHGSCESMETFSKLNFSNYNKLDSY